MGTAESGIPKVKDEDIVSSEKQGALIHGSDGTNYQVIKTDSSGRLDIVSSSISVSPSTQIMVQGFDFHQDPITGNALRIAGMDLTQSNSLDITATPDASHVCLDVNVARVDGDNFLVDTELPTATTPADGTSLTISPFVQAQLTGYNGVTSDLLRSDTTFGLDVDVTRVSGNVSVTQSGSWTIDTELPAAILVADDLAHPTAPQVIAHLVGFSASGNNWDMLRTSGVDIDGSGSHTQGVLDVQGHNYLFNGTSWDRLRGDITNGLDVDVTRVSGNVTVVGPAADGAAVSGNPVRIAGKDGSGNTQDIRTDTAGIQMSIGESAEGAAFTNPHMVGMKNLVGGTVISPHVVTASGVNMQACTLFDLAGQAPDFTANGETPVLAYSTDNTKANAKYGKVDSDQNVMVVGSVANDAVDSGNPVKVGYKVTDYEPDTSDVRSGGRTAVAENDRADGAANLFGETIHGVNSCWITLDNVSTTYNNTTTTATSTAKKVWNYRWGSLSLTIAQANAPTDIRIQVEGSNDGTNFDNESNGPLGLWIYDDTAVGSGISRKLNFPIVGRSIRVTIIATGTDATKTFTVSNAVLGLRN